MNTSLSLTHFAPENGKAASYAVIIITINLYRAQYQARNPIFNMFKLVGLLFNKINLNSNHL